MQEQYSHTSGPSLGSIQRPPCPRCGQRMSLARIALGASAFNIRTFECVRCRHVHTATAETDPMLSDALRWLAGHELRSPT
jgi:predicted  nucleic acid-binding Zn ribbon protein